jgi:ribosomal protein L3
MVTGIIARKIGMTQVFAADGTVSPATLVKAGPCVVLQAKAAQTDGYEAVQLGLVEEKPAKVNKALGGHYKKAGNVPPTRIRRELKVAPGESRSRPATRSSSAACSTTAIASTSSASAAARGSRAS